MLVAKGCCEDYAVSTINTPVMIDLIGRLLRNGLVEMNRAENKAHTMTRRVVNKAYATKVYDLV